MKKELNEERENWKNSEKRNQMTMESIKEMKLIETNQNELILQLEKKYICAHLYLI